MSTLRCAVHGLRALAHGLNSQTQGRDKVSTFPAAAEANDKTCVHCARACARMCAHVRDGNLPDAVGRSGAVRRTYGRTKNEMDGEGWGVGFDQVGLDQTRPDQTRSEPHGV